VPHNRLRLSTAFALGTSRRLDIEIGLLVQNAILHGPMSDASII